MPENSNVKTIKLQVEHRGTEFNLRRLSVFQLKFFSAFFRQLLPASPKAPTFGALTPAWPRPASRPVPGLTFSLQSCVSAVNLFIYGWTLTRRTERKRFILARCREGRRR
jgi:hypothetical protein